MPQSRNIGSAELEILRFIAEHEPVTVRSAAEHFARSKGYVRTTVLNSMERLRKKGYLRRRKLGGLFHYSPTVAKGDFFRNLVRDFVQRSLGGSVSPFVAYLADEATLTQGELADLKRLVHELEQETKK